MKPLAACLLAVSMMSAPAIAQPLLPSLQASGAGNPLLHRVQQALQPSLYESWESDFGPIHWTEGFYDSWEKSIRGNLAYDNAAGVWRYTGQWGRHGQPNTRPLEFTFAPDGKSFTGRYQATDGSWKPWNGKIHVPAPAPAPQAVKNPSPDISIPWDSDFGLIDWRTGYYDKVENIIRGRLEQNRNTGQWLYRGEWGRQGDQARFPLLFTFSSDGRSFTGKYKSGNGQWKPWSSTGPAP